MRSLEKKVITCEISFIPIQSKDYRQDVEKVIGIIRSFPVEIQTGLMSTTLRGEKEIVFKLVKKIFEDMENLTRFSMSVKFSNQCGCD